MAKIINNVPNLDLDNIVESDKILKAEEVPADGGCVVIDGKCGSSDGKCWVIDFACVTTSLQETRE
jgi:hypothetical protein